MLAAADICNLYAWLYAAIPVPSGTWDHILPVDGCWCATKAVDGVSYVMFRGSTTVKDWIDDFEDFALPTDDAVLGPVHPGFREGVLQVRAQLDAIVGDHVVIAGHSLGAGHAALYAGYRVAKGRGVSGLMMFGEPRPGGPKLSAILKNIPVTSYRNEDADGYDLITAVPRSLPPLLTYQHVKDPLDKCSASPAKNDSWGPFRYHHFALYAKALGANGPAVQAL